MVKTGSKYVAAFGGLAVANKASVRKSELNYIKDYRKKHPNSDLTEQEILDIKYKRI